MEPDLAGDYADRGTKAAFSVLIELGQILGEYRDKFVVVGGVVPGLILSDGTPPHLGTLDIDITLDPAALGEGEYADLVQLLAGRGYERNARDLKPFQLRRLVTIDDGNPVAVMVDLLMPRGTRLPRQNRRRLDGLRIQEAPGGEVALQYNQRVTLEGTMPDGRQNSVSLLVATIPALLVMKGHALVGRDKKKDAYDIYYSVRHYSGGPKELAAACRVLLGDQVARQGLEHIASKFRHDSDFGPGSVRMFMGESAVLGDMSPEQVQADAFRQLDSFLSELGIAVR